MPKAAEEFSTPSPTLLVPSPTPKIHPYPGSSRERPGSPSHSSSQLSSQSSSCRGLVLVGDAGGMVNPFNGEGIAYAMESGRIAAEIISQALGRPEGPARERALYRYPEAMRARLGGYYTLGRVFVEAIGRPQVMGVLTRYGLSRPTLMRFAFKLLANLTDQRGGDAMDRVINGLGRIVPAA